MRIFVGSFAECRDWDECERMESGDGASSSGVDKGCEGGSVGSDGEKWGIGVAGASGKLKVVRVKRKREQAPIESLCTLISHRFLVFFFFFGFRVFGVGIGSFLSSIVDEADRATVQR